MNTSSPRRIAVIGGGASATLFLAALGVHHAGKDIAVDIYDRAGRFARGIAYSTPHDCHLLNVRAGNMSALQDDKDHFAKWAQTHFFTAADFVPRRLYGEYLDGLFKVAQKNFAIQKITADVTSSAKDATGYTLMHNKGTQHYDDVILATGNVVALGPKIDGKVDGYLADPWTLDRSAIKKAKTIALIGTGLSAVDAVLTLDSLGFDGTITMISRRTLLPAPHVDPAVWQHRPLNPDDADKPLSHLLGLIRMHVREAAGQNIPWQAVIDSLRPVTNDLWQGFSPDQRTRFTNRLLTLWNIHRHRMAPSIAAQIELLHREGRLTFLRDSITRIAPSPVVEGTKGSYPFDLVINCMGYRYHEPDRTLDTTAAIGPARFGDLFETTAIPEVRAQANDVARAITA